MGVVYLKQTVTEWQVGIAGAMGQPVNGCHLTTDDVL